MLAVSLLARQAVMAKVELALLSILYEYSRIAQRRRRMRSSRPHGLQMDI